MSTGGWSDSFALYHPPAVPCYSTQIAQFIFVLLHAAKRDGARPALGQDSQMFGIQHFGRLLSDIGILCRRIWSD